MWTFPPGPARQRLPVTALRAGPVRRPTGRGAANPSTPGWPAGAGRASDRRGWSSRHHRCALSQAAQPGDRGVELLRSARGRRRGADVELVVDAAQRLARVVADHGGHLVAVPANGLLRLRPPLRLLALLLCPKALVAEQQTDTHVDVIQRDPRQAAEHPNPESPTVRTFKRHGCRYADHGVVGSPTQHDEVLDRLVRDPRL